MLHEVMKKRTPLPGVQPGRGLLEALGGEAPAREGAERAGGLVGEHARAAAHLLDLDGRSFRVFQGFELFRCEKQVAITRVIRDGKRSSWKVENQGGGARSRSSSFPGQENTTSFAEPAHSCPGKEE